MLILKITVVSIITCCSITHLHDGSILDDVGIDFSSSSRSSITIGMRGVMGIKMNAESYADKVRQSQRLSTSANSSPPTSTGSLPPIPNNVAGHGIALPI